MKTKTLISLLTLACLLAVPATAQVNYAISGNTAYVASSPNASGNIVIASTYNGFPVTGIGDYAFYDCTSLTSVTIPDSVTIIWAQAFYNCTSLTSVSIGNSVTSIEYGAFAGCTSLSAITVDALNSVYSSEDGVMFNKSQTLLIQCPGGKAGSYTIPNSVTNIGDGAFEFCTSLTSVTIPDSVSGIGYGAFYYCTSLSAITVDALNPVYSSVDGVLFNKSQTLLIQCPDGKAGSYTIPNSVTSIGYSAFYYCTSLASVTIPNSVTSIGDGAFSVCTNLTSVMIGNSVTRIGGNAFVQCTSLTSVTIPNSVTSIGPEAFYFCDSLTSVTIGNGVTTIGYSAFYQCASLTSVTIPNSVTSIGYAAFAGCTSLTSVSIGNSVTSIAHAAFAGCTNLTRVTIPNSVTSIMDYAFGGCTSLTSITIPDSVTNIGSYAFNYCTSLTSVTIPDSVTSIGGRAFDNCLNLTGVYFQGNAPSNTSYPLFEGADNVTVYYLPGTTGWGTTFAGRPTALWKPLVETSAATFGVRTNRFGFTITWANNRVVVVEAATNLANPAWIPVGTNTLTSGSSYFSDPQWTNHAARFYRLRSP